MARISPVGSLNLYPALVQKAFEDLPQDYMTVFLIILGILIFIFILLIIFFILLVPMLKRQSRLNFPIKPRKVISKERSLQTKDTPSKSKSKAKSKKSRTDFDEGTASDELTHEEEQDEKETSLEKKPAAHKSIDELPRAKPVEDSDRSENVVAVTPVRITSHHKSGSEQKSELDEDENGLDKKKK